MNSNSVIARLAQDLEIAMPDKLPQSVVDLCEIFHTQFAQTADAIERRAAALEARAKQLREMAQRISNASNTVPASLKRWVEEEIACRELAAHLENVNPDPDFT